MKHVSLDSSRARPVSWLLAVLASLLAGLNASQAGPSGPSAWSLLLENRNGPSRAAAVAELGRSTNGPARVNALQVLALLDNQEDQPLAALKRLATLYPLLKSPGDAWRLEANWPAVVWLTGETRRWDLAKVIAASVAGSPVASPELRVAARLLAAAAERSSGRVTEARKLESANGYLRSWEVIGPFDNVAGSGFERSFTPESHPGSPAVGKLNQELRWLPLKLVGPAGDCLVDDALGDRDVSAYYARTAVRLAAAEDSILAGSASGACRVWVNGRLTVNISESGSLAPHLPDAFKAPLKLSAGWNEFLVKLSNEDGFGASFRLRLQRANGTAIFVLESAPSRATRAVTGDGDGRAVVPATGALAAAASGDGEHAPLAMQGLVQYLLDSGLPEAAEPPLNRLLKSHPSFGAAHGLRADLLEQQGLEDEARVARERAVSLNPRLVASRVALLLDESAGLEPHEQLKQLRGLLKSFPTSAQVLGGLSEASSGAGAAADAVRFSRQAYLATGGIVWLREYLSVAESHQREAAARELVEAAFKKSPQDEDVLDLYIGSGGLTEREPVRAASLIRRRIALRGARPYDYLVLANVLRRSKKPTDCTAALRSALALRPQDVHILARLAEMLLDQGSKNQALNLYREAARLAPDRVDLRETLRTLSGERPVLELVPAESFALRPQSIPPASEYPGAPAVVLLDECRRVVYPDGASQARYRMVIKILAQDAVQEFESLPLTSESAWGSVEPEAARILKADGKIQNMLQHASDYAFSFPSLAPGDTIDVSFREQSFARGTLAGQFWDKWGFSIARTPVRLSRYVLLAAPTMRFTVRESPGVPPATQRTAGGWLIREWRMTGIPAAQVEVLSPPQEDLLKSLEVTTVPSWKTIADWYLDLSTPRCRPDDTIKSRSRELTTGVEGEMPRLRAIYGYVRGIKYQSSPFRLSAFVPTRGKEVMREEFGDCKDKAALLVAMLDAVGIRAEMVLLNTRDVTSEPILPSPRFNHAIVRVPTAEGPLWLDPTAETLPFGDLPTTDQGVPALVINSSADSLTRTPLLPLEKSVGSLDLNCRLETDLRLTGTVRMSLMGNLAANVRLALRSVPENETSVLYAGMLTALHSKMRSKGGRVSGKTDPDAPLTFEIDFEAPGFGRKAGNLVLVAPAGASTQSAQLATLFTGQDPRAHDLDMTAARGIWDYRMRIDLPDGYEVQDLHPGGPSTSKWVEGRLARSFEGRTLRIESHARYNADRVPVAEVPQFISFLREQNEQLVQEVVLRAR